MEIIDRVGISYSSLKETTHLQQPRTDFRFSVSTFVYVTIKTDNYVLCLKNCMIVSHYFTGGYLFEKEWVTTHI